MFTFQGQFMLQRFKKYFLVILVSLSILIPMALLYYVDAPSFNKTWKGRTFYLFFVWLFAMELILDWERYVAEPEKRPRSIAKNVALAIAVVLPTVYVIIEYFYGLNTAIVDTSLSNGIGPTWAYVVPLSIEYLVFAVMFVTIFVLAYGMVGLKGFSISASLLVVIGFIYMTDNLIPGGNFTPFQIIVPTTARLAKSVLDHMGYATQLSFSGNVPFLRAELPHSNAMSFGAFIDWPCSGVESLIIYTVVMLLFLKKTVTSWTQRIGYFTVGAVVTYFINILRIVTIYVVAIQPYASPDAQYQGFSPYHDYYGPLFSIIWITLYPLIIIGTQTLWKRIRPEKAVAKNDLSPESKIAVSRPNAPLPCETT
jgi:exosortase/archaeosortase family protein